MTDTPSNEDTTVELWGPPAFDLGDKVASRRDVRNDGTFPGAKMGEILIRKGEIGYVRSVGSYLNRFYVFGIDFVDSARLVGMRTAELDLIETAPDAPSSEPRNPS